jgi:hypothetical protein
MKGALDPAQEPKLDRSNIGILCLSSVQGTDVRPRFLCVDLCTYGRYMSDPPSKEPYKISV